MSSFAICTLGCKVNSYESAYYRQSLMSYGFKEVAFSAVADIYIINSCCLTNVAVNKSKKMIKRAIKLNPQAFICVVGCLVQIFQEELLREVRVDLLVGSYGKSQLAKAIAENYQKKSEPPLSISKTSESFEDLPITSYPHTRAFLKIQDGCNQNCSYCIIPSARGAERSLPLALAVKNAQALAENHREIVLVGIHSGRYGLDINSDLSNLLQQTLQIAKLQRLRLSSIEMTEISTDLIALIKKEKKMARHLHIPLQSGSDEILRAMNRPYTTQQYQEKIKILRQHIPDISISSDIIAGFPGEDENLWRQSRQFIEECDFSFLHVFPYSARIKTKAADLSNQLSPEVKKQRVKQLRQYSQQQYEKYQKSFLGKELEVLVETHKDGNSWGHSSEYIFVEIAGVHPKNSLVKVKAETWQKGHLLAR